MSGKGKKKNSIKTSENGENGDKKKSKKPAAKAVRKNADSKGSKGRSNVDIFNEHAMDNAYSTCHNVQDVLKIRGFPWPDAQKKKKKGKKGK